MFINNIKLLNETVLDSLNQTDEKRVIQEFTEIGIKILDASFGFVWMLSSETFDFELAYTSAHLPYVPKPPRRSGLNVRALTNVKPDFVPEVKKLNESSEYDVSQHMKSFVIIPIAYRNDIYGNIVICFKRFEEFSREKRILCTLIGNNAAQVITILRDLTRREKTERELFRLNRTLRALSNCNKAIVNSKDELVYLKEICRIIINDCGHEGVAVGLVHDAEKSSVKVVAYDGFGYGNFERLYSNLSDAELKNGPSATTIRTKKPVIYRNIQSSSNSGPSLSRVLEGGYTSVASFPLLGALSKVYGSITIYSKEEDPFIENESELLLEIAQNVSRGIEIFRMRVERQNAERIIKENEDRERKIEEDKLRTDFITDTMHEFRTPLAVIKGNVDLALKPGKKILKESIALKSIDDEISHLTRILSELTVFTLKDADFRKRIQTKAIKLVPFMRIAMRRWKALANSRGVKIQCKRIPPVIVVGDESYLDKLFTNLVKNAITYGKERGHVLITGEKDGRMVKIAITDDGVGISEEHLTHIFERFYRVDKSRSKDESQIGLGLAIAKWIAEAHGGEISVKSAPGEGSTFSVFLPLAIK